MVGCGCAQRRVFRAAPRINKCGGVANKNEKGAPAAESRCTVQAKKLGEEAPAAESRRSGRLLSEVLGDIHVCGFFLGAKSQKNSVSSERLRSAGVAHTSVKFTRRT